MTNKFKENFCVNCKVENCSADTSIVALKCCPEYINQHIKIVGGSKDGKLVALSKYRGESVVGISKCSPHDTFDYEIGKRLAIARCNKKVAVKRYKEAKKKREFYKEELNKLFDKYHEAGNFCRDAAYLLDLAEEELDKIDMELKS